MSDDALILMLTPAFRPNHVPGAVKITASCGHESWISPSGLLMTLDNPAVQTRCENCIDPEDVSEIRAVPGGEEELAALLGTEAARELITDAMEDPRATMLALQAQSRRDRRRGRK